MGIFESWAVDYRSCTVTTPISYRSPFRLPRQLTVASKIWLETIFGLTSRTSGRCLCMLLGEDPSSSQFSCFWARQGQASLKCIVCGREQLQGRKRPSSPGGGFHPRRPQRELRLRKRKWLLACPPLDRVSPQRALWRVGAHRLQPAALQQVLDHCPPGLFGIILWCEGCRHHWPFPVWVRLKDTRGSGLRGPGPSAALFTGCQSPREPGSQASILFRSILLPYSLYFIRFFH